jgi:hypothetical protein
MDELSEYLEAWLAVHTQWKDPQMMSARLDQTLLYYDGPQLVTLRGGDEVRWLGIAVDSTLFAYPVFCTQVSAKELSRYLDGHIDLRDLFTTPKEDGSPRVTAIGDLVVEGPIRLQLAPPRDEWLPLAGSITLRKKAGSSATALRTALRTFLGRELINRD